MQISDRMSNLKPSAIREMLKVTSDPAMISFAAGNPSAELFPIRELAELTAEIYAQQPATALQYSVTEGYGPLRELTAKRIREKYGIGTPDDDLFIVSGGQQGIDLATKCLVNEGDVVICENPSFIGALNAFRSYGARLIGVPVDADGMDVDAIEAILKREARVKMIYVIPTFQNPTGAVMSLERRKRLLELAEQYDVLIAEDSPYFELSFDGTVMPTIKSMDTSGHVLYLGSYSKVIAPGIRVGFACGPSWLISKMVVAKQVSDVHTNMLSMMVVARYLERYNIDEHIKDCRAMYKAKSALMVSKIREHFDARVQFIEPRGGLFIWCWLPEGKPSSELCVALQAHKVAVVPGMTFDVNEDPANTGFRLNFSVPSMEQIERGIALLGEGIRGYLG